MNEKVGRMPTAEVLEGPWLRLPQRKRLALFDALLAQESSEERYELILRILEVERVDLVCFGSAVLELCEMQGKRSDVWQRIQPPEVRRSK
jgi:hypothetical protein